MKTNCRALPIRPCAIAFVFLMLLISLVPVGLTQRPATQQTKKPAKTPQKSPDVSGEHGAWTLHTIGNATSGTARRYPPQVQIRGASEGYGPARDSLHFFAQATPGDFEISVRLDDVKDYGLGGLMVRVPGVHGTEPYFSIAAHPGSDRKLTVKSLFRPQQDQRVSQRDFVQPVVLEFPIFLKLRRAGSVYTSAYSTDGFTYHDQLRVDSKGSRLAGRDLNVGMVQSSEKNKAVATADFSMPKLQSTEPRVSELVSVAVKEPLVGGIASSGAIVRGLPSGLLSSPDDVAHLKSDSRNVKVPEKVVFQRGSSTATFDIQTSTVTKPTTANLTVLLNGQRKIVKVNLLPQDAITSITVRPSQVVTNEPRAIATVDLVHPAPAGGTKVRVSNSGRNVRLPSEVIVPAGERSVSFDLAGWGLAAGNNVVTVTGGGSVREGLVDLGSIGLPERNLNECPLQALSPDIATDGQRVYLRNDTPDKARVFLTGYRYNDSPPSRAFPQGEGRERIFCGCQRVEMEAVPDFDGGSSFNRPYFVVPMNAPSGDYTVVVKPKEGECQTGGPGAEGCQDTGCTATNLFVAPSYMVSRLNRMDINANAEDVVDSPSEMAFTFGSFSGIPIASGNDTVALVKFSGSYPAGPEGAGHLTNADNTQLFPELPLFIGRESRMINIECREECKSAPAGREAECLSICSDFVTGGRFSDHFEFQFGGNEFDEDASKWYGYVAGVGAAAVGCAISIKAGHPKAGCTASAGAGKWLSDEINKATSNDDDELGTDSHTYNHTLGGFGWGAATEEGPFKLTEGREKGDIDLYVQNFRVGGPRILQYKVSLKSLTVVEGYEVSGCEEPNEIFLNSRMFLYEGGSELTAADRFPAGTTWKLKTNQTENFGGVPLVLKQANFTPENAPESPLLFLEFGVWEDDEDKDLMGLVSDTIFLTDLFSLEFPLTVNQVSPEGLFVRRATMEQTVDVVGYEGSDDHCSIWAYAGDADERQARVSLVYQLEVTWLKRTLR